MSEWPPKAGPQNETLTDSLRRINDEHAAYYASRTADEWEDEFSRERAFKTRAAKRNQRSNPGAAPFTRYEVWARNDFGAPPALLYVLNKKIKEDTARVRLAVERRETPGAYLRLYICESTGERWEDVPDEIEEAGHKVKEKHKPERRGRKDGGTQAVGGGGCDTVREPPV